MDEGVRRARLDRATAGRDPVFAVVDLDAFDANASDLVRRAGGTPIRLASKSVRCRALVGRALARPGFAGVLAYALPEALWLATGEDGWEGVGDVLVGYPSADRAALARLCADAVLRERVTLMVDDVAQVALLPAHDGQVRVCLELDASYRPARGVHLGVRRSPLHEPEQLAALAARLARDPRVRVVGVMAYEAQVAGVGDAPPGRAAYGRVVHALQSRSRAELATRRREAVRAVQEALAVAGAPPLEIVNGGGTGSVGSTAAEGTCTDVAAGSGLLGPTLFDAYRGFSPQPAMTYATAVVRRPARGVVTVFGGGYVASGPAEQSRQPTPWLPTGLTTLAAEGAGEVQTPLRGDAADALAVGDRVWWRYAKAGEACERFDTLTLVRGVSGDGEPRTEAVVPTYRGESRSFG